MAFDTSVLDAAIRRRDRLERERAELLERVSAALRAQAGALGVRHAYVVGSLTRKHGWGDASDVDVAIHGGDLLAVMRLVEDASGRAVDVIDLDRHPVTELLRRNGVHVVWSTDSARALTRAQ